METLESVDYSFNYVTGYTYVLSNIVYYTKITYNSSTYIASFSSSILAFSAKALSLGMRLWLSQMTSYTNSKQNNFFTVFVSELGWAAAQEQKEMNLCL